MQALEAVADLVIDTDGARRTPDQIARDGPAHLRIENA